MADSFGRAPIMAKDIPARARVSSYPPPILALIAACLHGREKRRLGDYFGLVNFGVNLTRLAPQSASALLHAHALQDELIYILEGRPTLQTSEGRTHLAPGMCAGFKAGTGLAHHLLNETDADVVYLEIRDRVLGDEVSYPDNDLLAVFGGEGWVFLHSDGTPY